MDDGPPPLPPTSAHRARAAQAWLRQAAGPARARWAPLWRDHRPMVVAVAAAISISVGILGLVWGRCGWAGCPNVDRLRSYQPGKASRLLDRSGRPFAELRPVE